LNIQRKSFILLISEGLLDIFRSLLIKRGIQLKFKREFIFFIPILILLFCPSFLRAAPKVQFTIVYTNDVMGEVEPCG